MPKILRPQDIPLIRAAVDAASERVGLSIEQRKALQAALEVEDFFPDGRTAAWSGERRLEASARIRAAWAAKGYTQTYWRYDYRDVAPVRVQRKDIVAQTKLSVQTINKKLRENPDGFVIDIGKKKVMYAANEGAFERLLYGNSERTPAIPSKSVRTF